MLSLLPSPRSLGKVFLFYFILFYIKAERFSFLFGCLSYPPTAIFRPFPEDASSPYEPYVSPITADLIKNYTIPALKATIEELITLGV